MRRLARWFGAVVLLASAVVLVAGNAVSATETETQHFSFTESEPETDPCTGARGTLTFSGDGVVHVTQASNGGFHITGTFTFDVSFAPKRQSGTTYSGQGAFWFGENDNRNNENGTFTFAGTAKGSDGSHVQFNGVGHYTTNAKGVVTVEFEKENFHLKCA